MKLKLKALSLSFIVSMMFGAIGCNSNNNNKDDSKINDAVIANFMELTKIPRETYNEKQVSDYLYSWANKNGFNPVQDSKNNIIFNVPATPGYENKPILALQAHMDMVIAVEQGYKFDPKVDPIDAYIDGDYLKARHTSLGSDDGIGIAIMQYISTNNKNHGPIRGIITTDEEQNSTGVIALDDKYIKDLGYLVNIDSETSNEATISSASAITMVVEKQVTKVPSKGDAIYKLEITGGTGGHSGLEINKGRISALVAMCDLLSSVYYGDVYYQMISMKSGSAKNAIPTSAEAQIMINKADADKLNKAVDDFRKSLKETWKDYNPNIDCKVSEVNSMPETAMSDEDLLSLICYGQNAVSGVYSMSQKVSGLVESSANIGLLEADLNHIKYTSYLRSSENIIQDHLINAHKTLAASLGFNLEYDISSYPWPVKANNALATWAQEVYKEQNKEELKLVSLHAGLECGKFSGVNADMGMISVGPDIIGAHTIEEKCKISSIAKIDRLIEGLIDKIVKQ